MDVAKRGIVIWRVEQMLVDWAARLDWSDAFYCVHLLLILSVP